MINLRLFRLQISDILIIALEPNLHWTFPWCCELLAVECLQMSSVRSQAKQKDRKLKLLHCPFVQKSTQQLVGGIYIVQVDQVSSLAVVIKHRIIGLGESLSNCVVLRVQSRCRNHDEICEDLLISHDFFRFRIFTPYSPISQWLQPTGYCSWIWSGGHCGKSMRFLAKDVAKYLKIANSMRSMILLKFQNILL